MFETTNQISSQFVTSVTSLVFNSRSEDPWLWVMLTGSQKIHPARNIQTYTIPPESRNHKTLKRKQ